jgi:hypothetical protein
MGGRVECVARPDRRAVWSLSPGSLPDGAGASPCWTPDGDKSQPDSPVGGTPGSGNGDPRHSYEQADPRDRRPATLGL